MNGPREERSKNGMEVPVKHVYSMMIWLKDGDFLPLGNARLAEDEDVTTLPAGHRSFVFNAPALREFTTRTPASGFPRAACITSPWGKVRREPSTRMTAAELPRRSMKRAHSSVPPQHPGR